MKNNSIFQFYNVNLQFLIYFSYRVPFLKIIFYPVYFVVKQQCKRYIKIICRLTLQNRFTNAERISRVTSYTRTNRVMIDHRTLSIYTTQTNTWITTLLLYTRQMSWTFRINGTLWSTIRWYTDVIQQARTRWTFTSHMALSIRTTR